MPSHPKVAGSVSGIGGNVYSALAHKLATHTGEVYPLHVGDTWLEPAVGCRMQDINVDDHPGMHRYAPPQGMHVLIDAIAQRTTERMGVPTVKENVLVAAGATGALGAVMGAILDPGEEVIILAPYWPLINGIVRCFHGVPRIAAIHDVESLDELLETVEAQRGPKSIALYVSTPNNPSGRLIPQSWLEGLVSWAETHGLWIVADDVYEDYVYEGTHTYTRSLAPERTFSSHSFSKAFGMAGNRCGYVVGPGEIMGDLCKVSTHSFYSTPTASQIAAARALDGRGDAWVAEVREHYRKMGNFAAERLGVAHPEGSTFLFLDVAEKLNGGDLGGFLEACADRGLFLAPGPSFGPYPTHIRVCYTSAPPDVVERGVEILAEMLDR